MKPPGLERIEEMCEEIWSLTETGQNTLDRLVGGSKLERAREAFDTLLDRGLAELGEGSRVLLTADGERTGRAIVRRHRLAEVLFTQVLELGEELTEATACEMEHILSPEVTDSICTYLGHPPTCPHGKPIPAGACCEIFVREVKPLVSRLVDLGVGETGRIVFITSGTQETIQRIATLGVVAGRPLRLVQKLPSVVIEAGETTLAVDPEIARGIFVRRPA